MINETTKTATAAKKSPGTASPLKSDANSSIASLPYRVTLSAEPAPSYSNPASALLCGVPPVRPRARSRKVRVPQHHRQLQKAKPAQLSMVSAKVEGSG